MKGQPDEMLSGKNTGSVAAPSAQINNSNQSKELVSINLIGAF